MGCPVCGGSVRRGVTCSYKCMAAYREAKAEKVKRAAGSVRADTLTRFVRAYKRAVGCENCGYRAHHAGLHFDHEDPATKSFNIGMFLAHNVHGLPTSRVWHSSDRFMRLLAEIAKCRVLCATCHAVKTFENQDYHHWR